MKDDTISRQAAIDAVERIFDRCEEIEAHLPEGDPDRTGYKMYPDYVTVWKYLHQLPSAQSERPKGEWMVSHIPDSMLWECNQCGFDCGAHSFNFCPNCGARMTKEDV